MRFIHLSEYEYMNMYNIQSYTHIFSLWSKLQHLNNLIYVTDIQVKGLIFGRPPAKYDGKTSNKDVEKELTWNSRE